MDHQLIATEALNILRIFPKEPFLCLPMSAALYAVLKDTHGIQSELITGDLAFKEQHLFKQDFSISEAQDGAPRSWAGHAWVQINDLICDLSFFRTLYSDKFTKPCKSELIQTFGVGRGCLLTSKTEMVKMGFLYMGIDKLNDDIATAIIKGVDKLPIWG